ncbi:hypothetical protein CCR75_009541 [Bremia lactucae]|uniref:HNH nuclease domain-containing protein n=1 Tax=Bremia lactucae TaxID=4779 RepID=A0A976IFT0_BRELC|nr:hypothetical protein CCR75_009541 [Bremia lactucae]
MVTLLCVIVGVAGKAFPVDINTSQFVGHLKDKIKEKAFDTIKGEAHTLQLFLAKTVDDKWLSSCSEDVKKLKEGEKTSLIETLTSEDKELQGNDLLEDVLIGMERPLARQIHVLVVLPEQENDRVKTAVMDLVQVMVSHMLMMAPTTRTTRNEYFKHKLCKFYKSYQRSDTWVRCMVLDVAFPKSFVVASHLFRRSNEYVAGTFLKISDIDDARNGIVLFKPLKYAFDHFHISFLRDNTGAFRLKLFDPTIRNTRLIDMVINKSRNRKDPVHAKLRELYETIALMNEPCEFDVNIRNKRLTDKFIENNRNRKVLDEAQVTELHESMSLTQEPCKFNVDTTFGDVDGSALAFIGVERPFNRCLNLQARVARVLALKNGWVEETYDFPDFWDDVDLTDKMDIFLRSLPEADI